MIPILNSVFTVVVLYVMRWIKLDTKSYEAHELIGRIMDCDYSL
jgi:hypothetical protein